MFKNVYLLRFLILKIFILLLQDHGYSQSYFSNFDNNKIYILARGTKSKQNIIVKVFNISDTNFTHIGIGYFDIETNKFNIYNINPSRGQNAFTIDSIPSFISPPDIYYYGIWEINIGLRKVNKARKVMQKYKKLTVNFDYDFLLDNRKSSLYCSEFVWLFLNEISHSHFNFLPVSKELNFDNLNSLLNRKTFIYIPVDFFLQNKCIKKIADYRIQSK